MPNEMLYPKDFPAIYGPGGVKDSALEPLAQLIKKRSVVERNSILLKEGADIDSIYIVGLGSFKSFMITSQGQERISAFYLPSDLVGLEGFSSRTAVYTLQALELSVVFEIDFDRFVELTTQNPMIQRHIFELMAAQSIDRAIVDPNASSEERLARFLVALSGRQVRRQLKPDLLTLPMSREDIGRYLGIATETVSRCLTRLQKGGVLSKKGKHMHIHSFSDLRRVASGDSICIAVD